MEVLFHKEIMITFAKVDVDAGPLEFNQLVDDRTEFGMDVVFSAKPEIKKIAQYEKMVDCRFLSPQRIVIDQRADFAVQEL
jgi:hypothetical protein